MKDKAKIYENNYQWHHDQLLLRMADTSFTLNDNPHYHLKRLTKTLMVFAGSWCSDSLLHEKAWQALEMHTTAILEL